MKALVQILAFASALVVQAVYAGPGSSGGGNLFIKQPGAQSVLLDLIAFDPTFVDDNSDVRARALKTRPYPQSFSISIARFSDQPAYSFLRKRLEIWRRSSPIIIAALERSISHMEYFAIPGDLKPQGGFVVSRPLKTLYPQGYLVTAIAYGRDINGVVISASAWSHLGLKSQAGSMVHEGFRDIQMGLEDGLSDDILQTTTARIILTEPGPGETLDRADLFGTKLASLIQYSEKNARHLVVGNCDRWRHFLDQAEVQSWSRHILEQACAKITANDLVLDVASEVAIAATGLLPDIFRDLPTMAATAQNLRDESVMIYLDTLKASLNKTQPAFRSRKFRMGPGFGLPEVNLN